MTEAEKAEFNRKATLANHWARDAQARRIHAHPSSAASPAIRAPTPAPQAALVEGSGKRAPDSYGASVLERAAAMMPDLDSQADLAARRILAARYGEVGHGKRDPADIAADVEAERILQSVFGARRSPETCGKTSDAGHSIHAAANSLIARGGMTASGQRREVWDPDAARILKSVFGT